MTMVETLGERFDLKREVGSGAMGSVYEAWDRQTESAVAVKVLRGTNREHVERFEREAVVLSQLAHPGIVRYVGHGQTPLGDHFLAMEWLEGETLERRLSRGRLSLSECATIGYRLAESLAEAHEHGIVHRDIKPANLVIPAGDLERIKIVDFGIARRISEQSRLTHNGIIVGTPLYMSPEQARGDFHVDARADVFSLASVLFECLTGEPPFVGATLMAIWAKIVLEPTPKLRHLRPGVPPELDLVLAKMFQKNPDDRPVNAVAIVPSMRAIYETLQEKSFATTGTSLRPLSVTMSEDELLGARAEQRVLCVLLLASAWSPVEATGAYPIEAETLDLPPRAPGQKLMTVAAPSMWNDDLLSPVLSTFGGRLEKLIDGSMVVTLSGGAPTEQAVLSARCALTLCALLPATRIALCTGKAVMSDKIPIGEVIDRGVRILEHAAPSAIVLDETSAGLLDGRFEIGNQEGLLLLEGEKEMAEAPRTLLGKVTHCVGRDRDLDILQNVFLDCVNESEARAVLVTSVAGGGKSRFRHEFLRRAHELASYELLLGRADSLRARSPFSMIAPAIRWAAGIRGGGTPELAREMLEARVRRHVDATHSPRISEFLGELMGLPPGPTPSPAMRAARADPRLMGDQILAASLDFLAAECSAHPVLVVLEDLHWGDPSSVHLLDSALRALRDKPFFVLALGRPEVTEAFPQLFRDRNLLTMNLAPLNKKASERLVQEVLGDQITAEKRKWLIERADGNAFYLEELMRAVAEGNPDSLPDSVLGMVHARLDTLGDDAKKVLRAGSVFGECFREAGARALLGGDRCRIGVPALLSLLTERELLFTKGDRESPEYVFRHALVRDAAYALLTDEDRTLGHAVAGEWLEEAQDSTPAVLLAGHFERGANLARAIVWYRRAADKAFEGNDLTGVISCAERAIACGAADETFGELSCLLSDAHQWRGENEEAKRCSLEAMRQLPRTNPFWFRAAGIHINVSGRMGHAEGAAAIAQEMLDIAAVQELDASRIVGMASASMLLLYMGREDLTLAMLDRIRRHAQQAEPDPRISGWMYSVETSMAAMEGDTSRALRLAEQSLAEFRQVGDLRSGSKPLADMGCYLVDLGAYDQAEPILRETVAAADRMGLRTAFEARANLGFALGVQGATDEGCRLEEEAIREGKRSGDSRIEGAARYYLARILLMKNDFTSAEREARQASQVFESQPTLLPAALATLGLSLLRQHRASEALETTTRAYGYMMSGGAVEEGEIFVRLVHAEVLRASGDLAQGLAVLQGAREKLLERAAKISEDELRESYLSKVLDHARVEALLKAWSGPSSEPLQA